MNEFVRYSPDLIEEVVTAMDEIAKAGAEVAAALTESIEKLGLPEEVAAVPDAEDGTTGTADDEPDKWTKQLSRKDIRGAMRGARKVNRSRIRRSMHRIATRREKIWQ